MLPDDYLALIHVTFEKLLAEWFDHDVAGRSGHKPEDLSSLHHLEQISKFELQIAGNFITVFTPAAVLQCLQQSEDPGHLAIWNWINPSRHQARSSINEKTLSVSALNASLRRSRGRAKSTLSSAAI